MNYGMRFLTLYRRQGSRPSPWKRNAKKQNGCLRRPYNSHEKKRSKKQRKKERYKHLNAEFQRIERRNRKGLFSDQCKETEENIEWERLAISSRKFEIPREHFMQRGTQ